MKKLVLTFVVLVAVATTSFAQYPSWLNVSDLTAAVRNTPSIPSMPTISYSMPSPVNYNTTTVSGYSRSNGTYVQHHVRTMPNDTNWDNFSTKGNKNPFTGSTGYRARDYSREAYNYGRGHVVHTGSKGGQFYYNNNGNKTYVPKRSRW